jgi:hypothetical protein
MRFTKTKRSSSCRLEMRLRTLRVLVGTDIRQLIENCGGHGYPFLLKEPYPGRVKSRAAFQAMRQYAPSGRRCCLDLVRYSSIK